MKVFSLTAGALGAGLMYFFDPDRGRSRRVRARDKSARLVRRMRKAARVGVHDLRNRTSGVIAGVRSSLMRDGDPDDILVERARARLGHATAHPRAIHVVASDGTIHLEGPVLAEEARAVRSAIRSTRGVRAIDDHLEVHDEPDVPELLTGRSNGHDAAHARQRTPAGRLLMTLAAGAAAVAVGVALGNRKLGDRKEE